VIRPLARRSLLLLVMALLLPVDLNERLLIV